MSSVRRTIQVLDLLARKGALGVRAVAHELSLPAGSVHRLLADLEQEAAIERNATGAWQLGFRLLDIVELQLDGLQFQKLARPFCEAIAIEFGETVNLNAAANGGSVCVDKVRGNVQMQLDWRIGMHSPYHCGGSAKAILAYMPRAEQESFLTLAMRPFTVNTITTAEELRQEMTCIRERGYAIDNQEIVMGVFCVAVPILDRSGRPVGAISISGPSPKSPGKQVMPMVERLNEVCSHVSEQLGYSGGWAGAQHRRLAN